MGGDIDELDDRVIDAVESLREDKRSLLKAIERAHLGAHDDKNNAGGAWLSVLVISDPLDAEARQVARETWFGSRDWIHGSDRALEREISLRFVILGDLINELADDNRQRFDEEVAREQDFEIVPAERKIWMADQERWLSVYGHVAESSKRFRDTEYIMLVAPKAFVFIDRVAEALRDEAAARAHAIWLPDGHAPARWYSHVVSRDLCITFKRVIDEAGMRNIETMANLLDLVERSRVSNRASALAPLGGGDMIVNNNGDGWLNRAELQCASNGCELRAALFENIDVGFMTTLHNNAMRGRSICESLRLTNRQQRADRLTRDRERAEQAMRDKVETAARQRQQYIEQKEQQQKEQEEAAKREQLARRLAQDNALRQKIKAKKFADREPFRLSANHTIDTDTIASNAELIRQLQDALKKQQV